LNKSSEDERFRFPLTLNWTSDGKDSYFFPTSGTYQKAGLEVARRVEI
jgi:outer membrane protein insertion porin family